MAELSKVAEAAVMDNDAILAKISEYHEAIKRLKAKLQPTKPREEISLLECNKAARLQRKEKFKENDRIKKAVEMALSRGTEKKDKKGS